MSEANTPKAWLLLAAGNDRSYGGNTGYDDDVDAYYSWDDTVKNYGNIQPGDRIAVWDKRQLLGISVVEAVDSSSGIKLVNRCPKCNRTNISERTTLSPRFKCQKCFSEFESPVSSVKEVSEYRSRHDAAWTDLSGLLTGDEVRALCLAPKSQHSMRELDWNAFSKALELRGAHKALKRVLDRSPDFVFPSTDGLIFEYSQGHGLALVRVRRGQGQFRAGLLAEFSGACAFTGTAPERVLEAGHLYSYAELGEHHLHGGLLLRRDVHRLFDDGGLAVDPNSLTIDVSGELEGFPQYAKLHDRKLEVHVTAGHMSWLENHWAEHRK